MPALPSEILTQRLLLRPFRPEDAAELLPILEANQAHIAPWIPTRVSQPVPVPELAERLTRFSDAFTEDREWRFAVFSLRPRRLLGEVDLFPRDAEARVAFQDANRAEIGYWLREDATGQGFVVEAARVLIAEATKIDRFTQFEIRCEEANAPSGAVAKRLGFELAETIDEPESRLQVWTMAS